MKKSRLVPWYDCILLIALFVLGLVFIYSFTVSSFGGDSNQYFSWVKDIYTHHGSYFSWTTAAGYNQFSVIHLFSLLVGSVTYKSPAAFFLVVNYFELTLLTVAGIFFVKLVEFRTSVDSLVQWIYGLPFCVVVWTLISLFAGTAPQSMGLQATDLFLIFVDSFIIISIGWFLFLLNKIFTNKELPKLNLACFIFFQLYFSITTLRFLSGAILTEAILLGCILIRSRFKAKIVNNNNDKAQNYAFLSIPLSATSLSILFGLCIIFVIGYYGFFAIEPYSSSARFVMRGGETGLVEAWNNASTALGQYFAFTNLNFLIILLRGAYLIILAYGLITLLFTIFPNRALRFKLKCTQLFALLTAINFILVTSAGLFSNGTVFLDTGAIAHYYELSAIFAFLTFSGLILDKFKNPVKIRQISLIGLFICMFFSLFYIKIKSDVQFPTAKLLNCINVNKNKYQLKNGMGDFWVIHPLMAETEDIRFSVIGTMATNLDYNWQHNLTQPMGSTNFLVYTSQEYKDNALNLLNLKIPTLNYQGINCGDDTGIIVFDLQTAKYIDQFRNVEFNNSKAWFFITSYGTGQSLWAKMPWNQKFIESYHEYFYYGSLLRRISQQVQYHVTDNLSMEIDSKDLSQSQPVLMTEMIHAGSGSYYLKLNSELSGNDGGIFVVNLRTQQPIANLILHQAQTYYQLKFNLDNITPIALVVIAAPDSKLLLKDLVIGKLRDQ